MYLLRPSFITQQALPSKPTVDKMNLVHHGVTISKDILSQSAIEKIIANIRSYINIFALEIPCEIDEHTYMDYVCRWEQPSAMADSFYNWVAFSLQSTLAAYLGEDVKLHKILIINEGRNGKSHAIPVHQDISNTKTDPHDLTVWIPLQKISSANGSLEFLPGSHTGTILPPIDFCAPNFKDEIAESAYWKSNAVAVNVDAGGCIFFDSRVWYRSMGNDSKNVRFSLVTNWRKAKNHVDSPITDVSESGWSKVGDIEDILRHGLEKVGTAMDKDGDMKHYIEKWLEVLVRSRRIPFEICRDKAQSALNAFMIVYYANLLHNGNDSNGTVYSDLWTHFVLPLKQWLTMLKDFKTTTQI